MKKLFIVLSLIGTLSLQQAVADSELKKNLSVAQPVQTKYPTQTLMINRYPLADHSDQAYANAISSAVRDFGSGDGKTVNIIWANTASEKSAVRIRDELIRRGVLKHKISVVRSNHKRPIYPIYIEVEKIAAKATKCRFNTAEDMMAYNKYDPCATKNNYRIQLKN